LGPYPAGHPPCLLTTLVVPAAVFQGTGKPLTLFAFLVIGLRRSRMSMVVIGWGLIVVLRAMGIQQQSHCADGFARMDLRGGGVPALSLH